jgi:hypothetical protein
MMRYVCPVCESVLTHERIDDETTTTEISESGDDLTVVYRDYNGTDSVTCRHNSAHELGDALIQDVIDLVQY